jgi:predicted HNH restriction endonuclease
MRKISPDSPALGEQDGNPHKVTVHEVAVLCSNCHRMIHHRRPAISIAELKTIIETTNALP